ncbi:MAG: transposase [Dehalococcoidia bacterium]
MPQVVLRTLTDVERGILDARLRDKTLSVRVWERYRVVGELSSARPPAEVADRVGCHVTVVYDWLHRFNESGFSTFELAPNPKGRPATIGSEQIRALIRIATSKPEDLGLPFTDWSVAKLHKYCADRGLLPECTDEWVRRLLRREGLTYQRTKTWKQSNDPEFEAKKGESLISTRKRRPTAS